MRHVVERRKLGPWLDGLQVLREPANDNESLGPPALRDIAGLRGPRDRRDGRDERSAALVEICDELRQQLSLTLQLEAQRAPSPEIVGESTAQRDHAAPPGHACARSRMPPTSTMSTGQILAIERSESRSTLA